MQIRRTRGERTKWQQVKEMVKAGEGGLHVGDEILDTLKDGQKMAYVVAHITEKEAHFISKDCMPERVAWNEQGGNAGGFRKSTLCRHLNTEVWKRLPEGLRAVIDERECLQIVDGEEEHFPLKLWLPTEYEVFEDSYYSEVQEGEQFEIFKDVRNRIKGAGDGGSRDSWWLLSAVGDSYKGACGVDRNGISGAGRCNTKLRVPVCFTIKI